MGDLSQTKVTSAGITLVEHVKKEESVISPYCRQPYVYVCAKYEVDLSMERCITMSYIHVLLF